MNSRIRNGTIAGLLLIVGWGSFSLSMRINERNNIKHQIAKLISSPHDFGISRRMADDCEARDNPIAELGWIMFGAVCGDQQSIKLMMKWQSVRCKARFFPAAMSENKDSVGEASLNPWNFRSELAHAMEDKMWSLNVESMQPLDVACAMIELSDAPKGAIKLAEHSENVAGGNGYVAGMGWWLFGMVRGDQECMDHVNKWLENSSR